MSSSKHSSKSSDGFTLIELLVVVGISALFSAFAITYSNIGRNETALIVEESKIAQLILQAKELSIATYTSGTASCGYGVRIDAAAQTYSIFAYSPSGAPPCPPASLITGLDSSAEQEYTPGTWQVPISNGVVIEPGADALAAVLFYPPAPTIFLSQDNANFDDPAMPLTVYLQTVDGKNSATISVSPGGQVNL